MSSVDFFIQNIKEAKLDLSADRMKSAALFAQNLYQENENQNLTRISEKEFATGHLIDVLELLSLPSLGDLVLDIGSGCGVPGLLAAAIDTNPERRWFLCESERGKSEYLEKAVEVLGLSNVEVIPGRAEEYIQEIGPDTVIARAVGNVEKISGWIWNCSTWNNLVLFKSRGWEEEWKNAQLSKFGKKLTVTHLQEYEVEGKYRNLATLKKKKK